MALLPFEDAEAEELLVAVPGSERRTSWHLVHPSGRYTSRAEAAIDWLETLGHARAAHVLARVHGPVEGLYTVVAEHREHLGRLVPDGPAPRQFP